MKEKKKEAEAEKEWLPRNNKMYVATGQQCKQEKKERVSAAYKDGKGGKKGGERSAAQDHPDCSHR